MGVLHVNEVPHLKRDPWAVPEVVVVLLSCLSLNDVPLRESLNELSRSNVLNKSSRYAGKVAIKDGAWRTGSASIQEFEGGIAGRGIGVVVVGEFEKVAR